MEEVVNDVADVYPVGSFVQIMEMQDLGNKLRMVVMSHRRIKLVDAVTEAEEVSEASQAEAAATAEAATEGPPGEEAAPKAPEEKSGSESGTQAQPGKVYSVNTENLEFEPWETTDEIKAITQEVVKTIRDIIVRKFTMGNLHHLLYTWPLPVLLPQHIWK